ncbi:DUF1648 domain-containing protein [Leucobacter sp. HY1910]
MEHEESEMPDGERAAQAEEARRAQIRRELLAPPRRETMMSAGSSGGAYGERPARTYVTGRWTARLRVAALALTGVVVFVALVRYPFMPDTIAVHFNLVGEADGWGPRWSIFILIALAVVMTLGLAWLSHHPRVYNYPADISEGNAQQLYRVGEQMMVGVTLGIALSFAGVILGAVLPVNLVVLTVPGVIVLLASIVWGIVRPRKG